MIKDPNDEKQIEELARSFCGLSATLKCSECSYECFQKEYARKAFEAGYRRIYDDHQRQCTCYALGYQMADSIEKKIATKIFTEVERVFGGTTAMWLNSRYSQWEDYEKLKKKYTEGEKNE